MSHLKKTQLSVDAKSTHPGHSQLFKDKRQVNTGEEHSWECICKWSSSNFKPTLNDKYGNKPHPLRKGKCSPNEYSLIMSQDFDVSYERCSYPLNRGRLEQVYHNSTQKSATCTKWRMLEAVIYCIISNVPQCILLVGSTDYVDFTLFCWRPLKSSALHHLGGTVKVWVMTQTKLSLCQQNLPFLFVLLEIFRIVKHTSYFIWPIKSFMIQHLLCCYPRGSSFWG